MAITLLDGAMGTELLRRGVSISGVAWSADALDTAPDVVRAIHRDYVNAGARLITANTFRTTPRASSESWRTRLKLAVSIAIEVAREATGEEGPAHEKILVAGSIAPLEDCYRPDLAPEDDVLRREHREIADALAESDCDLLLCETFASPREAVIATECAAKTSRAVWTSLTAGFRGDLLSPEKMRETARACVSAGASAILVNCVPVDLTRAYVDAIAGLGAPFGAYANLDPRDGDHVHSTSNYVQAARTWIDTGATLIGGCCGTTPDDIRALAAALSIR